MTWMKPMFTNENPREYRLRMFSIHLQSLIHNIYLDKPIGGLSKEQGDELHSKLIDCCKQFMWN